MKPSSRYLTEFEANHLGGYSAYVHGTTIFVIVICFMLGTSTAVIEGVRSISVSPLMIVINAGVYLYARRYLRLSRDEATYLMINDKFGAKLLERGTSLRRRHQMVVRKSEYIDPVLRVLNDSWAKEYEQTAKRTMAKLMIEVHDLARSQLVLYNSFRDQLGQKPVYYCADWEIYSYWIRGESKTTR